MRVTPHPRQALAIRPLVAGDWMFAEHPPGFGACSALDTPVLEARGAIAARTSSSVDDAEAELAHRVRAAAPTRRVLCALAARAIESRSWSRLGFARAGDQTRERQGISARSLQELARVHRVLAEARSVDAAFQTGRIGWTTARALGRIEDQALWLGRAKALSLPDLERAVRRAREGEDAAAQPLAEDTDEPLHDRVPIACTRPVRAKWSLGRELARRVAGGRLPSWECAEVLAAEMSSAVPLGCHGGSDLDEAVRPGTCLGEIVPRPPPAGGNVAADHADGEGGEDRDREPSAGGPVSKASTRWGGPPPLPPELARLLDGLAEAYRSGRLSWVQTQALAPLLEAGVGGAHTRAWVDRAGRVTVRRLEDDVRGALAPADLHPPAFARTGGVPEEGVVKDRQTGAGVSSHPCGARHSGGRASGQGGIRQIGARGPGQPDGARQTGARGGAAETATLSFHAPTESARFFRAVLEGVRERIAAARGAPATEGEAFEAMLDHAIQAWSERDGRVRLQHRIFERDGWRCAVPGCTSHRNLQVHHVVFRSQGGDDEPENLITLCAWHHQRGVHGGLVRITGRAPDRLRFELGLRDGKPPLAVYDSGDRLLA